MSEKLNADREQVPAVAVPHTLCEQLEIVSRRLDRDGLFVMCEIVNSAIAILSSPSHSQQSVEVWQPIETAPKDGAMVLLFVPLKHNGKFHVGRYRFKDGSWWTDSHSFVSNPTHWMPLPEPPSLDRCPSHDSEQGGAR